MLLLLKYRVRVPSEGLANVPVLGGPDDRGVVPRHGASARRLHLDGRVQVLRVELVRGRDWGRGRGRDGVGLGGRG